MPIIALIGPSGAGKSTLVDRYVSEHSDALFHKSVTTRPVRSRDDTSHRFLTEEEFDAAEREGTLLQPIEAYGYRYALPLLPDDKGQVIIVMIRQQFVYGFVQLYPHARIIHIEASVDILVQRLTERGDASRIDAAALASELQLGRHKSHATISTDEPFASSYAQFVAACQLPA